MTTKNTPYMPPVFQVQLVRDSGRPRASREQVNSPMDAIDILTRFLDGLDREHLVVLLLDNKNRVIGLNTVAIGSINEAIVTTRETFKPAILSNAVAIIIAHNHPSGDPAPSPEDIRITRKLVEAGKILDIEVLDHIIIGENSHVSLKEQGLGFEKW